MKKKSVNSYPSHFLKGHKISERQRAKMVDWVLRVIKVFHHSHQTAFLSVYILDLYLKRETAIFSGRDLYLLGVVSVFIASKISETRNIQIDDLLQHVAKSRFSKKEILKTEKKMLLTIGFKTNPPIFSTMSNLVLELLTLSGEQRRRIKEYSEVFQFMFLYSSDLVSEYSPRELVGASLIIATKLLQFYNPRESLNEVNFQILRFLDLRRDTIIKNLKFLRDFVSCFKESFAFSCLNTGV